MNITENSAVSLTVVASLLGGIFWLSAMWSKVGETADRLQKIEDRQGTYEQNVAEIKTDIAVIKCLLKKDFCHE